MVRIAEVLAVIHLQDKRMGCTCLQVARKGLVASDKEQLEDAFIIRNLVQVPISVKMIIILSSHIAGMAIPRVAWG